MKFAIAFALLPLIGTAYAAPASSDSVIRKDGHNYDKSADKDQQDDGKDYDHAKHMSHYPDNLESYPNKHCDARYQNFLDLLLDDVCAKFYGGDRKHNDKKHKRDGKDYRVDDAKKDEGRNDYKEVKECDDKADKLLDEACRTYYHYQPKDDGKDQNQKEALDKGYNKDDGKDHGHNGGKKDDGKDYKYDDKKDGGH